MQKSMTNFVSVIPQVKKHGEVLYKEFILDIIEPIELKMSPFCHFYDQKREVNVILIYFVNNIYFVVMCMLFFQSNKHFTSVVYHQFRKNQFTPIF